MAHRHSSEDPDNAELAAILGRLSLAGSPRARPPPYQPDDHPAQPPLGSPLYQYSGPIRQGFTRLWSEAGAATQGVPGAHVHAVIQGSSLSGKRYVVFHGLRCGVFDSWNVAKPLVHRVSCALHRSYPTLETARAAFAYAEARSWTRVIDRNNPRPAHAIPALPQPIFTADVQSAIFVQPNPLHLSESIQDNKWYIVYKGIHPGVYRSYLESQLNVLGLSSATHDSVEGTLDLAIAMYLLQAVEDGNVSIISPAYTEDNEHFI
ncbi:Cauli-VI domain-containing protein [Mycena venus]|uniref:Cauli-VI domain-containing protein n=1 Tax=Mycena venus TaxID=2733690 RepID=A0A8H6X7Q5_9AGAR|nr:Cauli-VI domain-containing protein [Mycena venus]